MGASSSSSFSSASHNTIPSMGASSSSSIDHEKSFKYDVFLSFRGTDTRNNFIDHLYQALNEKGIYTFKDDERITKGQKINDELLKSIEDSRFYIVVFSKNYASSSWCLDELVKIMEECQKTKTHTAYPVFYDVGPTEVRHQTGEVGKAFSIHGNDDEAVGKWRNAMKDAADLAGFELKNTADGSEVRFIKKIIEDISLELYTVNFSFDKNLVGMETRVNDIVSSLQIGVDDVRMIGIKGMGGAGKTTLARSVFDKISIRFEGTSFVENVREVTSNPPFGLKSLQQQILSDVLKEDVRVSGVRDGQNILKRRMHGRKVLIVLDDVDDIEQLEALAGDPDWFKSGSRIIITTRDEQVLLAHGVTLIRDVNLLSNIEAICLFSKYAFRRDGPVDHGYEELSEQVVRYASGLPLTIKVLGSLLFRKDKHEWEDALQRLKTMGSAKTLKILELSYVVLEDDQKEIFLDVACIMKGWQKDKVIKALESCGFRARIGLRVLQQKSLITIYDDERVGMHDRIEEMGRNIVRRLHPDMPHKHSRLWKKDEIEHILANDLGTEEIRCMFYVGNVDPYILIKGLGKMKALRYLYIVMKYQYGSLELNTFSPSFPDNLRYLSWKYYPFKSLPKTFKANKLVTLEMPDSEITQLWEGGEHKVLDKLRFLDISRSKLKTIDLRLAPNLETLDLGEGFDMANFFDAMRTLPEDLGHLEDLQLSSTKIKHLPNGICMLKHLKYLKLDSCKWLEKLPEDLGHLECLEDLDLAHTKIKHLPQSICKLKRLSSLRLKECLLLENLPKDLGKLECLMDLDLSSTKIKHLPYSICMLKHLKSLCLSGCVMFEKLPEDLDKLECLERLDLSCTKIKHLPDSIFRLKDLNFLSLEQCLLLEMPEDLGELKCLMDLNLSSTEIKHLPDSICKLKHLNLLTLRCCSLLEKLPEDLGELECLRHLDVSWSKIKHLPDSICKLMQLDSLLISGCLLLEKLPEDLGRLKCLKRLSMTGTGISQLPHSILLLKGLHIYGPREFLHSIGFTMSQIKYAGDKFCWVEL